MNLILENWRKEENLLQKTEDLLSEVTVDEVEHIADVLNGMRPEDLSFKDLFGDKYRLVIDFPTLDTTTEVGQFINLWKTMGYDVDWKTGIVTANRELRDLSPEGSTKAMLGVLGGTPKEVFKTKKIQMKIGKWFGKLFQYVTQFQELEKKVLDHVNEGNMINPKSRGEQTGKDVEEALDEQEQKNYYRLSSYINMMIEPPKGSEQSVPSKLKNPQSIEELNKYWKENAAFIKENAAEENRSDKYSIIITRHPIDVLRMSDFDNIQSCHSPPSRGGASEYYKCAVAEAHGHGAVAYVVKTDDLLHATNTSNIESAEQEIQSGEVFNDPDRPDQSGKLLPLGRVRLRQIKFFKDANWPQSAEEYAAKNPDAGIELAVPEVRMYPSVSAGGIPELDKRILQWARQKQENQISEVPIESSRTSDKAINLDRFIKYGGSYEDNRVSALIKNLWGPDINVSFKGTITQDTDTEDNLDADLLSGALMDQYQEEVIDIQDRWNNRMAYCEVEGNAVDDGDGSVWIAIGGEMYIKWNKSEWKSLPNWQQIRWGVEELSEFGWSWAETGRRGLYVAGHEMILQLNIIPDKLRDFGGQEVAYEPSMFEDFARAVDTECDDSHDAIKHMFGTYAKREGWMEGGALMRLGMEVESGDIDLYEWDGEAEEGYEYGEFDRVSFETNITIPFSDINSMLAGPGTNFQGINEKTAPLVADDRNFSLELRKEMAPIAQKEVGSDYYPPVETTVLSVSPGEIYVRIVYYAVDGDPDGLVEVLKSLVENWDDEYELQELVNKVFARVAKSMTAQELSEDLLKIVDLDEERKMLNLERKLTKKPSSETSLRDWFKRKGAPGKKGGWVDCNTCRKDKKTGRKKCKACGRSGSEKRSKYPSCRPTPAACGKRGKWGKKSKKGKKG